MRTKVTLALLFLNAVVFFFIFNVRHRLANPVDTAENSRLVLPSSAADIREIAIHTAQQDTRLVRRGELWCLDSPIDWPANPHAVSRLLTELQSLRHETSFTVESLEKNQLSLKDYGLEPAAMTVTLTTAAPEEGKEAPRFTLRIGNPSTVDNRLYVLSPDGQRIHVVSSSLAESLTLPLDQLRSTGLFTIPDFEARNFTIQPSAAVSARTRLHRDGNRWLMENPIQTRAASAAVRSTLAQLTGLQTGSFISQPLPPELSPSATTTLRITIEGNNRSETLLLGGQVPREDSRPSQDWYAQFEWRLEGERKSAVFTVTLPQDLLETLRNAQERLRETRILDLDVNQITAISLSAPDQPPLTLQRLDPTGGTGENIRWQLVQRIGDAAPLTQPADGEAVTFLLSRLAQLEARRFVTDAPGSAELEALGFNRPERRLSLEVQGASKPIVLECGQGAEKGSGSYARLDSSRSVYEIDPSFLTLTHPASRNWRDRNLMRLPAGASISRLVLRDLQSGATLLSHDFAQDTQSPDTPQWETLATGLRNLRAKSFLSEHYADQFDTVTGRHGWTRSLEIGINLNTGSGEEHSTRVLNLSERLGGTLAVAGSADLDVIFELEQNLVDALWNLADNAPRMSQDPESPAPAP